MAPNSTFDRGAPVYDGVDYAQVGRNGQLGASMAAEYAVAQGKGGDSCYAVAPGASARSEEYAVPHTLNPNYQSVEAARGGAPAVAGEYDSVTFIGVSVTAGRGSDTYAVPDQSAAVYASTSSPVPSLGRAEDQDNSEA